MKVTAWKAVLGTLGGLALVIALLGAGEQWGRMGGTTPLIWTSTNTLVSWWDEVLSGTKMTMVSTLAMEDQLHSVARFEFQGGYEAVAASQTDQVMGGTGAIGDLIHLVTCSFAGVPSAQVSIKDGGGSAMSIMMAAGADAKTVILDVVSTGGAWKVTTGTNTTCVVSGRFT